ncbi:hypothetical protein SERLADRAFT_380453 [Serpula lacrymans var. lacrymans S7.9]|uniref:Uncharacterized protein n=1 Tax=Serpula lacrymans var. lacrymans (strain S7.9) TaxID=578457 RepID=F8NLG5_SERL9|nr:uncharacterized protein SERLADRAFT_380453 [Serpula lacrymans var. lacrymans S7.9]EGO28582.1 hypothetical protein SERLADRAFT_380453 [Serpula lacrymans var. lacrymans S7.9]
MEVEVVDSMLLSIIRKRKAGAPLFDSEETTSSLDSQKSKSRLEVRKLLFLAHMLPDVVVLLQHTTKDKMQPGIPPSQTQKLLQESYIYSIEPNLGSPDP